ncbi:TIGR02450 family Trp-rich protein [Zhongshania sp.]|jgi:tryptophan-rich hypothetical protein|uniref:TIGR02450 family Trp-rich protein n=1 Tax=Zhongshania sp. TaxID=1971902 RepID=UPI0039E71ECE
MSTLNPKKLLNSKWTAVKPERKEKHFIIIETEYDEDGAMVRCLMQAVMTKREFEIEWHDLKNIEQWRAGWL